MKWKFIRFENPTCFSDEVNIYLLLIGIVDFNIFQIS